MLRDNRIYYFHQMKVSNNSTIVIVERKIVFKHLNTNKKQIKSIISEIMRKREILSNNIFLMQRKNFLQVGQ